MSDLWKWILELWDLAWENYDRYPPILGTRARP